MLVLKNLCFKYQDGIEYRFNLELKTGDSLAVMGSSGAGKSTLLNLIAGFLTPSKGEIIFNNQDIARLAPNNRPINMLFQEHNLFQHLNVFDNVALGVSANLKINKSQNERIEQALIRVGLSGFNKKLPHQLSGGQKQRVALARTLVRNKPMLLLDEPFSFLDLDLHHEMIDLVKSIQQEHQMIMIMVTHNPEDALKICNKNCVMKDGGLSL
jgi:thiamine transport system ATP-binding protein